MGPGYSQTEPGRLDPLSLAAGCVPLVYENEAQTLLSGVQGKVTPYCLLLFIAASSVLAGKSAQPVHVIPFEMYRNAVWLPVGANGSEPLSFIVDSAAGNCVISREAATRLGLHLVELGEQRNVGPAENKVQMAASPNVVFTVGGSTVTTHGIVLPFDLPSETWGKRFDGALGYPWLVKYVTEIDYDSRRILLYDPDTYEHDGVGTVLPLRPGAKYPVVRVKVGLPNGTMIEGDFGMDTGGTTSVIFNAPFVRQHDLISAGREYVPRLIDSPHVVVGGTGRRLLGRVPFVELGPFRIDSPVAGFVHAEAGSLSEGNVSGFLGSNLLHRFNIVFDYSRDRVILRPNSHFQDPDDYDMSGMGIRARGSDLGEFYVHRVLPDSPAEAAGVEAGDLLVALDGRPTTGLRLEDVTRLFTQAGAEREVTLSRNGQPRKVKLLLRKLL